MYHQVPPTAARCQHIHADNTRCGSPPLRKQAFCHWHTTSRTVSKNKTITIPVLDDPASIQLALTQIISRLVAGELDPKIASIAINGLRIAAANEKHLKIQWSLAENELTPAMAAELLEAEKKQNSDASNVILSEANPVILSEAKDQCIPAGTTNNADLTTDELDLDPSAFSALNSYDARTLTARPERTAANSPALQRRESEEGCSLSPEGTAANSPALQRRESEPSPSPSPVGTPEGSPLTSMLPEHKAKALKRIIRKGPRHPLFHSAARLLDKHTAAVANARNGLKVSG